MGSCSARVRKQAPAPSLEQVVGSQDLGDLPVEGDAEVKLEVGQRLGVDLACLAHQRAVGDGCSTGSKRGGGGVVSWQRGKRSSEQSVQVKGPASVCQEEAAEVETELESGVRPHLCLPASWGFGEQLLV